MIDFKKKMNVSVSFFLRGKEAASLEKACAIYATIDVDGKKGVPFSTKFKVPVKYWMASGSKIIKASTSDRPVSPSFHMAEKLNEFLTGVQKFAYEASCILQTCDQTVTPESVKELIFNPRPLKKPIKYIETLDQLVANLTAKNRRASTMLTYRTRRNNIHSFLIESGNKNLMVDQFRYKHFEALQVWMLGKKRDDGEPKWSRNTVNKHLTLTNHVLKFAVNQEYIRANPIGMLNLEYEATKPPQYLLAADRQRIQDCNLSSLKRERDISVFLMHTGLSYTDYLSLGEEHLFRVPSGEWFIKKSRDKSDVYSIIPLLTDAHSIIKEYGSVRKMPRPDISDLNKMLKVMGEVSAAPFQLSTSTFRETFSSMMENEYMVPTRLLMFMMGHTNPRQLRNYSTVMPARILYELNKNEVVIPFNLDSYKDLVAAS